LGTYQEANASEVPTKQSKKFKTPLITVRGWTGQPGVYYKLL